MPLLLSASLLALGAAWLMATPPGSAPDEGAHYVKALGAGGGDMRGSPPVANAAQRRALLRADPAAAEAFLRAANSRAARWQARTRRQFRLPRELVASTFGCTTASRETTGACTDGLQAPVVTTDVPTYVGTYQPYVYVPTGVVMRAAAEPRDALRLGRLVTLAGCLALLLAALWLLWSSAGPRTSLLGFALAVSPMVVFVASVLAPTGPEVAGAVCFAAALLRLARDEPPPRGLWVALAAGGAALAASRALGPAFAVLILGAVLLLAGPRKVWPKIKAGGAKAAIAFAVVAIAGLAGAIWEFAVQPRPEPSGESLLEALAPSLSHLPKLTLQAIGIFGSADSSMPWTGYALWLAALLVLGGAALAVGQRRDRLSVLGLAGGLLAVVIGMSLVYREIGPLQGRYALPVLVLLPLWLGEVLHRNRELLPPSTQRHLAGGLLGIVALVQAVAWLSNAHRFAVGQGGSWSFLTGDGWAPPPGWPPWALLAAAGAASLAGAAALALSRRDLD